MGLRRGIRIFCRANVGLYRRRAGVLFRSSRLGRKRSLGIGGWRRRIRLDPTSRCFVNRLRQIRLRLGSQPFPRLQAKELVYRFLFALALLAFAVVFAAASAFALFPVSLCHEASAAAHSLPRRRLRFRFGQNSKIVRCSLSQRQAFGFYLKNWSSGTVLLTLRNLPELQ